MIVRQLSVDEACERLEDDSALFMDVRDQSSYLAGHIPGAEHVSDQNIEDFVGRTDKGRTVVVYCYHGNSSMGGAEYLQEHGFEDVYSMAGGFTAWGDRPSEVSPRPDLAKRPLPPPAAHSAPAPRQPSPGRTSRRKKLKKLVKSLLGR